jgi:hypothetical protein
MMTIAERQAGVAENDEGKVRLPPDAREASVWLGWPGVYQCGRVSARAMRRTHKENN